MLRGFLAKLRSRGIKLWLEAGALKFKAYHNAPLTAEDKVFLRENKSEVMAFLTQSPAFFSYFPLSENQKSMWLVYQANPQSAAYNLAHTVRFHRDVDVAQLQQAYGILCERHEVLRTAYSEQEGESVQRVLPDYKPAFVIEQTRQFALAQAQAEADKPFDLVQGEVCRAILWLTEQDERIFQLTVHHIAADFWSCEVLFDELLDIYQALSTADSGSIANLGDRPHFDYFAWSIEQNHWRESESAKVAANYWKNALSHSPNVLEVPTDKPRPNTQSFNGEMLPFSFDAQQSQGIRDTAKALGVTPFVLCFAAYQVLLYRYSGQTQFNIGTPTSGRLQQDYQRTIGYLVNPVVMACESSPNATFAQTVEQVKQVSRGALAHQQWPLSQLMPMLDVQRDPSRNPLFQHLFALTHVQSKKHQTFIEETYLSEQRGAALDISLIVLDDRSGFTGEWRYNTDLYERATAFNMIDAYKAIIEAVCANPQTTLKSLPLMQAEGQQQVLETWANGPKAALPKVCIHTLVEAQAQRVPNAKALVFEGQSINYAELNQRANQLANYLIETQCVRPDARIGLYFERSIDMVVSLLAVLKAGAAFVPLDPDYPADRIHYMCMDAGLSCVLSSEALLARIQSSALHEASASLDASAPLETSDQADAQFVALNALIKNGLNWVAVDESLTKTQVQHYHDGNIDPQSHGLTSRHLAYVMYTSGSTGKPKGVMVEHGALVNQTQWINRAYPAQENDRFLLKTPFSFDVSQSEFMWALTTGSTLVIAKPQGHKDPIYLSQLIQQEKITKAHFVPALLAHTLALGDLGACTSLKQVFCAGEALPAKLIEAFYQTCPHATLYNLYGPTEATIFTTFYECEKTLNSASVPIGRPVQNTQIYVLDAHLQPVPKGAIGELYIGGDSLARGYLNRPALTQAHFIQAQLTHTSANQIDANPARANQTNANQTYEDTSRLYKTGDLVRWLEDGNIEYIGRADSQVKLRGLRIELGEIESVVQAHDAVDEAVVLVQTSANQQQHLVGYIVCKHAPSEDSSTDDVDALKHAITHALRQALPDYMVPSAWVVMPSLPLSPNGKVDRNALPKADFTEQKAQYRAPETQVEIHLANAWENALDIQQVGRDDSFFALGGNSLSATRALAQLQTALGVQVSLKTWFENPVLSQLATAIESQLGEQASEQKALSSQIQEGELYPLSFSQQRLWFIDRMEPGNTLYNLFFTLKLSANLQVELFEKAVNDVVNAHQILRTNYVDEDGEGRQKVRAFEAFSVPVETLSDTDSIDDVMRAEANIAFDLQNAPRMLRVTLLKREKHDDYLAMFTVHHIAFDAFSNVTFLQALNQQYSAYLSEGLDASFAAVSTENTSHQDSSAQSDSSQSASLAGEDTLQFADYALWQREWLHSSDYQTQADYWQQQLQDAPASLNLPTEYRRPLTQTHEGDQASLVLSLSLSNRIRDLVASSNSTLYMVMLAGFNLLLSRYAQQSDISVGTSVANRSQSHWHNMLGFFVNTLVMRNQVDENESFSHLLEQVKNTAAEAYSHQDMPFDKLVELLDIERDDNQSPLFQVMFVLNNALDALSLNLADVDVSIYATPLYHARFDLTLRVTDGELASDDRRLRCDMEFNTALYSKAFVERMLQHYQHVLAQAVEQFDAPLRQLTLLPEHEAQQVLSLGAVNTQDSESFTALSHPHKSITSQFEYWAAHQPDYPALRYQGETFTYGELNAQANVLAHHLLSLPSLSGAGQLADANPAQPRIGILLTRSPGFIVSLLAALKAGAAYVPLDTQWPCERLTHIVKDSGITLLLSDESVMQNASGERVLPDFDTTLPDFDTSLGGTWVDVAKVTATATKGAEAKHNPAPSQTHAEQEAYLIYTSGSTGEPKGVVLNQGNVLHYIDGVVDRFSLAGQSFALISTVAADLGNTAIFGALCFGGTLDVISEDHAKDAGELAQYLAANPVDVLKIVPSHLQGLMSALNADGLETDGAETGGVEADGVEVDRMETGGLEAEDALANEITAILPTRCLIVGGEASSLTFIEAVQKAMPQGARIVNHYGPTETTVGALAYEFTGMKDLPSPLLNDNLPIGKPLPGNRIYVVGEQNQLCPVGVPGELLIAGAGVAQGYHNRDALNQSRFVANPFLKSDAFAGAAHAVCYRTGDKVRLLPSGDVEFLGRLDDQVKIRGYRVEIGEVESVLRGLDDIQQAAIGVTQREDNVNQLVGYVVLQEGVELAQAKAAIEANLADYMVPQHLITLAALPVTPNGKLDRRQLPDPYALQGAQAVEYAVEQGLGDARTGREPRNDNERMLAEIWCQVLRTDTVSIDDNFFDIGGDSILSLQIIARAKKAGLKITPKQLFQQKTIAALAEVAKPIAGKKVAGKAGLGKASAGAATAQSGAQSLINDNASNQHALGQRSMHQSGIEAGYQNDTHSVSTQPFALTPIQHWFFEGAHPQPHHWNQSVLLAANLAGDESLNFEAIQLAVSAIIQHHDALSLRFKNASEQAFTGENERIIDVCEHIVLPRSQTVEQALQQAATRVQQSLNIETGPVLRVALFDASQCQHFKAGDASQYVLIAAHHLVVDGVSWRIVLSDLQQAYQQALGLVSAQGNEPASKQVADLVVNQEVNREVNQEVNQEAIPEANQEVNQKAVPVVNQASKQTPKAVFEQALAIQLDEKSASFAHWSEALHTFAQSKAALNSLDYWSRNEAVGEFPVQGTGERNVLADMQSVERKLSSELTQQLLKSVPAVYRTQISDILLTALTQQLARVTQNNTVLVELEGHGREDLIAFMNESLSSNSDDFIEADELDLSRTVGWFTSRYPVYLTLPDQGEASATVQAVKSIKEQLRAVPHKGLSFGVLRYLSNVDSSLSALKQRQTAPISFNYLGQFDNDIQSSSILKPSALPRGVERCEQGQRGFLIDINALIQGGELSFVWHYSQQLHDATWMAQFADEYMQALTHLIKDIVQDAEQGISGVSPSDFPLAQLSQPQVDALALDWANVEVLYPLTPMQEGLLFHTLMNPNTGIYFMQYRYELNGEFDHHAFTQAWQQVVQRHDVLRTAFLRQEEKALQVVYRHVPPPVEILDWCHLSAAEQDAKLPVWMSEQLHQGFDLSQPTQLAITLIRTQDDKYQLIRSFHHILTDAWCFSLIMMDFLSYYHAIVEGNPLELPAPRPFEDYVAWLQKQDINKAERYWRDTLSGFEAPTSLGVMASDSTGKTGVADALCHLSQTQTASLQRAAQTLNVTLNTLVQAAWGLLLSRYSGDSDIVFGVTVAGRPTDLEGAQSTVGLFINTLPLRMQVSIDSSLSDYVQQIFQTNINMREHEFAPLVDIQRWSDVPPGSEMFDSLFVYENAPIDPEMYKKLSILEVGEMTNRTHTNYPITVVIFPQETLGLQITYDKARFDDEAIERMLQHFQTLLLNVGEAIAAHTSETPARVRDIEMLSQEEQWQHLLEWNQTDTDYPRDKCWPALFFEQVKQSPSRIAVACEDEQLTYAELYARSQQVASALLEAGVQANDIVAVLDDRGTGLLVMITGILSAGAAYLPLDPKHPVQRVASIIELSQPKVVLGSQAKAEVLTEALSQSGEQSRQHAIPQLMLLQNIQAETADAGANVLAPVPVNYDPNDLAYVIYTSGSTGVPKGAMVEHLGMLNNLYSKIPTLALSENDVIAQTASQCFDISVWQFLTALVCGAKVQIYGDDIVRDPATLLSAMQSDQVSILEAVPSLINSFLDDAISQASDLAHLRWLMPTGEALSSDLVRRWFARHPAIPLINAYGPAECADDVSMWKMHSVEDAPCDPVPIGTPTDNNRLYVLDAHHRLQPAGVMGEIYVAGAGVGRGYLNDPKRTADAFIDNLLLSHPAHESAKDEVRAKGGSQAGALANPTRMYRTGDLARWRSDGVLEYLGRTDHQVKIRGFRIELGEIEACLDGVDAIRYAAVVVKPDPRGADTIVAYYEPVSVLNEGATQNQAQALEAVLVQAIRNALPEYMMPSVFVALEAMPLSRNGKIDRKSLPDPSFEKHSDNLVEAQTETELALVPLWQHILQLEVVDIHASFFALGGHSLLAAQLHARVCQQFDVDLPLRSLFEQNSLAQVAKQVDARLATQNLLVDIEADTDQENNDSSDADMEEFEL